MQCSTHNIHKSAVLERRDDITENLMRVWNPPPQSLLQSNRSITTSSGIHTSPHFVYAGSSNTTFPCRAHLITRLLSTALVTTPKESSRARAHTLTNQTGRCQLTQYPFLISVRLLLSSRGARSARPETSQSVRSWSQPIYPRDESQGYELMFSLESKQSLIFIGRVISDQDDPHETGAGVSCVSLTGSPRARNRGRP